MRRTPTQDKALAWYVNNNELRLQLSAHPIYFFTDKHGKEVNHNIVNLASEYEEWKKGEKRNGTR